MSERDLVAELARCKQELDAARKQCSEDNAKLKRHIDSVENQLQAAWELVDEKNKEIQDLQARLVKSVAGESAAYAKLAKIKNIYNDLKRDFES